LKQGEQNSVEGLYVPSDLGTSQNPEEELDRGMSGSPSWTCCLHNWTSDERKMVDEK